MHQEHMEFEIMKLSELLYVVVGEIMLFKFLHSDIKYNIASTTEIEYKVGKK